LCQSPNKQLQLPRRAAPRRAGQRSARPLNCGVRRLQPMSTIHQNFLLDLGTLLRERAVDARDKARIGSSEFESGVAHAYYEVMSPIESQTDAFGLPLADAGLKGFSVDEELMALGQNHQTDGS